MPTLEVDAQAVVQQVRRLAEQYPDAKYVSEDNARCLYTRGAVVNGPPTQGCIVGQALVELYPETLEFLQSLDASGRLLDADRLLGLNPATAPKDRRLQSRYHEDNRKLGRWLLRAQSAQDISSTWSEAVQKADELCEEQDD